MKIARLSSLGLVLFALAACATDDVTPTQATPPGVASFTTGTWALKVTRAWDGQTGAPQFPSDTIADSAYLPVSDGPAYQVAVSAAGQQATISGTLVGTVQAQRVSVTGGLARYDLTSPGTYGGGRLVVWSVSPELQAELTFYGSGVPIIKSERGVLVPVQ